MSATNAYPSPAITFTFPDDPFCGRVNDSTGAVVYQLYLEQGFLGGKKSSSISRIGPKGNAEPVGEINWGGWTCSRNIVIGRIDCGRLLVHRSSGWFSPAEYWFTAGDGREYYWKRKESFAASGQRVATYTRRIFRLFHPNMYGSLLLKPLLKDVHTNSVLWALASPATLSVDQSYSAPAVLDFILVSALLMEKRREDEERRGMDDILSTYINSEHHAFDKKFLKRAYYFSRIAVASIIVLCATLFPPFDSSHLITQPERKFGLASALLRWDVFHFSNIALNGYNYEHLFAFFPGTPFLMRLFAEAGLWILKTAGFTERTAVVERDVLLGGAAASFMLCDWTGDLYDLTIAVGGTPSMAKLTTLLSLVPLSPPALLFAPYAEPFFATLSYKGMLACRRRNWIKASVCFMLATTFRSNGTMLAGFIIWGIVVEPLMQGWARRKFLPQKALVTSVICATVYSLLTALPFVLHQVHGYYSFCTAERADPFSPTAFPPWCSKPLPLIYGYVQKQYWDVGFLRYWRLPQIPNFLFAAPIMTLLLSTSWKQARSAFVTALEGWSLDHRETTDIRSRLQRAARRVVSGSSNRRAENVEPPQPPPLSTLNFFATLPHAIHCLIFSSILLVEAHVQIVLRLSSSMPYTYWAAAGLVMQYKDSTKGWNWTRIWVVYLVTWAFVSMLLWAAFLPPA